jgi:hypothetical protein
MAAPLIFPSFEFYLLPQFLAIDWATLEKEHRECLLASTSARGIHERKRDYRATPPVAPRKLHRNTQRQGRGGGEKEVRYRWPMAVRLIQERGEFYRAALTYAGTLFARVLFLARARLTHRSNSLWKRPTTTTTTTTTMKRAKPARPFYRGSPLSKQGLHLSRNFRI